jgi:hypothetical protein
MPKPRGGGELLQQPPFFSFFFFEFAVTIWIFYFTQIKDIAPNLNPTILRILLPMA